MSRGERQIGSKKMETEASPRLSKLARLAKHDGVNIAACLMAALVAAGAYSVFGFIGVGILGLAICFIATRLELEDGRIVGTDMNETFHARQSRLAENMTLSEKGELRSDRTTTRRGLRFAVFVGLTLIVIGGVGFFIFDMGGGRQNMIRTSGSALR